MTEVLLVDGSGILHHHRAGIASHLGVVASVPTIGVTKKLLCGSMNIEGMSPGESRPVVQRADILSAYPVGQTFLSARKNAAHFADRNVCATVPKTGRSASRIPAHGGSRRPIFVSPGHRVDLPFCGQLVRQLLTGRRLPEPLYWADRLGKS